MRDKAKHEKAQERRKKSTQSNHKEILKANSSTVITITHCSSLVVHIAFISVAHTDAIQICILL